jgi:hypothetical protein
MGWFKRFTRSFAGGSDLSKLEQAVEKAAQSKPGGWYLVTEIKAHKVNPITEYHVELDSTTPPPP